MLKLYTSGASIIDILRGPSCLIGTPLYSTSIFCLSLHWCISTASFAQRYFLRPSNFVEDVQAFGVNMADPNAIFQNCFYIGNQFNGILYGEPWFSRSHVSSVLTIACALT